MFAPVSKMNAASPVSDISGWVSAYKEAFVDHQHDLAQLTLVLPDDCLIVVGPPRLAHASGDSAFHPVGFINNLQYTETRQVQPLKALGSRRHIFSATNAPVQGSFARMLLLGRNLLNSFYTEAEIPTAISDRNSKYAGTGDATWWANIEEDLFRIPFGLGIIYGTPAAMAADSGVMAGAEYLEVCTLVNRSVSSAAGQAMVMEQVAFMADRVLPWDSYGSLPEGVVDSPMSIGVE